MKVTLQTDIFFLIFNQSVLRKKQQDLITLPVLTTLSAHSNFMDQSFVYIRLKPRGRNKSTPQINMYWKKHFRTRGKISFSIVRFLRNHTQWDPEDLTVGMQDWQAGEAAPEVRGQRHFGAGRLACRLYRTK